MQLFYSIIKMCMRILFVISIILGSKIIFADEPGVICGYVFDSRKNPVENVHVILTGSKKGDVTDIEGYFLIERVNSGIYSLVIDHIAYKRIIVEKVRIKSGETVEIDPVKLEKKIIRMQGVVISALRRERKVTDVPFPVFSVSSREIMKRNAKTTSEVLREETNVFIQKTSHGGGSAVIRGLGSNQILLLVDGIRLNNSVYRRGNHSYLTWVDNNALKRIEVVRGPSSILYGSDALGGVINTITRTPEFSSHGLKFHYGLKGRYASADNERSSRAELSVNGKKIAFFSGFSLKKFGDLRRGENSSHTCLEKNDVVQKPTGFDCYDFDSKLVYAPAKTQKFTLATQYTKKMHLPRYDKYLYNDYYLYEYHPQIRKLGYLKYENEFKSRYVSSLKLVLSWQSQEEGRRKQSVSEDPLTQEKVDVHTSGFTLQLNSIFGRHSFTYGTDIYLDNIFSERFLIYTETGERVKQMQARYPDGAEYLNLGFFLQDELSLGTKWSAVTGIRYSVFSTEFNLPESGFDNKISQKFNSFTASVGLLRKINDSVFLNASVRQAFRAPNLSDLSKLGESKGDIYEVPNQDLEPEKMLSYDLGMKVSSSRLSGQFSLYYASLRDLIASDYTFYQGSPIIQRQGREFTVKSKQNTGDACFKGIESSVYYNFTDHFSLRSNISFPYGQNITRSEPVSGVPPAFGLVGLRWDKDFLGVDIYLRFAASQKRISADDWDDPRIPEGGTPGWSTWNFRLGCDISGIGRLQLAVENIFDLNYREHGSGVNGPGRNFIIGFGISDM